jgi:hypothetical protein
VSAEINVVKAQRYWTVTRECSEIVGKGAREFCQQFHKLNAELASANEAQKLETRIADIGAKLAITTGSSAMAEADPQATVLARLGGVDVATVQTALTVFVALLIEIGSAFGMYVAFAYWRVHDQVEPRQAAPATATAAVARPVARQAPPADERAYEADEVDELAAAQPQPVRRLGANDNRVANGVPDSDVQRFYRERIVAASESSSVTSSEVYEDYCSWCEVHEKVPFAHPRVTREIAELGVKKERIGKRTRYFGIALRSASEHEEDKKLPLPRAA